MLLVWLVAFCFVLFETLAQGIQMLLGVDLAHCCVLFHGFHIALDMLSCLRVHFFLTRFRERALDGNHVMSPPASFCFPFVLFVTFPQRVQDW